MDQPYTWDFFISHAGPDLELARSLYKELKPPAKVFLDDEELELGDTWSKSLSQALYQALISIILISPNTDSAYYEQEEIAIAIERTRADPHTHRVVPVYLNGAQLKPEQVPFGLKSKHGLYIANAGEFVTAREKLLKTLSIMKGLEVRKAEVVAQQQAAVDKLSGAGSSAQVIAGLFDVTKMMRPLLMGLLVLFGVSVVLLFVFMFLPTDDRSILLISDGSLCLLLLGSILLLIERALRYAPQIAAGNINAG